MNPVHHTQHIIMSNTSLDLSNLYVSILLAVAVEGLAPENYLTWVGTMSITVIVHMITFLVITIT